LGRTILADTKNIELRKSKPVSQDDITVINLVTVAKGVPVDVPLLPSLPVGDGAT
jgi:hypothetical protein